MLPKVASSRNSKAESMQEHLEISLGRNDVQFFRHYNVLLTLSAQNESSSLVVQVDRLCGRLPLQMYICTSTTLQLSKRLRHNILSNSCIHEKW